MVDCDGIVSVMRERQLAIRREMDRRGLSLKVVAFDSGIPYPTLVSYFPMEKDRQPAQLPIGAFHRLIGHIPQDLLDVLLPDGFTIMRVPEGLDADDLARQCGAYMASYAQARHPQSEAGIEIGPTEKEGLLRAVPHPAAL